MKKIQGGIASGLLMAGILSSALLPAMAKTSSTTMSSSKMSGSKMSGSKMSSKMSSKGMTTQMTGTVTSMTANSLTVKPTRKSMGTSKTVTIPSSAKIMMGAAPTSLSNLKAGEKVTIMMNRGQVTSVRVSGGGKMSGSKMSSKKS